ncbi:MAG: HTH-type transcriptional regulator BhcR, partial [Pararhizobium sp.]
RTRGRPRSFNNTSEGTLVQALDRAMGTLKVVANGNGLSLTEIAEATGQAPATAYRALLTMQKHGVVEFDTGAQLWRIGVEAFRIGSAFLGRSSIVEQARPKMQEIMATTGETANLAIVDCGEVVFVSQVETHEPIRAFFRPGTRGPVHASGIGKALLAFFPDEALRRLLGRKMLDGFTDKTITDREALAAELASIRARGFAVDDEERTVGMRCIAAPIFNAHGEAVAGISVSGPSVRVTPARDAEYGALVRRAADAITRATGGRPPKSED